MPGAESCVATQDLAKAVEARLGRPVFVSAAAADVSVEGRIEPGPGHTGFRAVLTLHDAHGALLGTRELNRASASCDDLREPLALVVAVMVDPDAALHPTQPVAAPPEPPAPVVIEKPVYVEVPVVAPPPKPQPVWKIDVGASAATVLELVPAPNLGVAVSGLLYPPGVFPLEGFGAVWWNDGYSVNGIGGTFALGYLGGGLCPLHYEGSRLRAYGCGISEIGIFSGSPSRGPSMEHLYLALGLEGRMSVRIAGPFAARLGLNGVIPLFRPDTFSGPSNSNLLFRPGVAGAALDLGVGVLLP
jgi:hypothetical protein